MKKIKIGYISPVNDIANQQFDAAMRDIKPNLIDIVNWKEYDYVPEAVFKIAYTDDAILLRYAVKEKYIRANYLFPNDPVYKDSCVEFFISFDGKKYYNFEFNCIGTTLASYGNSNKETRMRLSAALIDTIQTNSKIQCQRLNSSWELSVKIPINIFNETGIKSLKGIEATANFYKCGDDLPLPHFLSWNEINHPSPNFHLPAFFGEIVFD
ncbi:carbohydrate-binding family 9-like protein [Olivibacter domesticus]|uniref:Carbohydrate-binding family 9 n=1 Tax=Olivibacter domesticus TaxID=407022 RepID=A0A1H7HNN8_OLID1|nr:carbohydrate-binding family 9-like protein [Olivibacter domesticus]SEK51788.1 Carbohydrate-binding family 9 [Olivibacter domesticus]